MKPSEMHNGEKWLLALLRHSLWNIDMPAKTIGVSEYRKVLELAKEHTVSALVSSPVINGNVSLSDRCDEARLRQTVVMEMLQNEQIHRALYVKFRRLLHELAALFRKNDIHYVVFKGVAVASHYATPYLRTMGDIDFYVVPTDFERAILVIEREWHVNVERDETDKHYNFDWQGIRFEMHHRIETFGRRSAQRKFDIWMEKTVLYDVATLDFDGELLNVLPPVADVVVVFKHMMNHLLVEGVGLRQVVDLAILLDDYKQCINTPELRVRLQSLGYLDAFDVVVTMLHENLALPCAMQYAPLKKRDVNSAEHMLALIMESGNFGRRAYRNSTEGWEKSWETAVRAFRHCLFAFRLMPLEMSAFIPRRIAISLKKNFSK